MLNSLARRIAGFILTQKSTEENMFSVYSYGIELLISSVLGVLLVIAVGFVLGNFMDSLLFLISFIFLRKYTGGLHCNSYTACNVTTVLTFVVAVKISGLLNSLSNKILCFVLMAVFIVFVILLLAPVSNPNKPVLPQDRVKYKTIAMIIFCFHLGVMILFKNYICTEIIIVTDFISCVYVILGLIKNKKERSLANEVQKGNG